MPQDEAADTPVSPKPEAPEMTLKSFLEECPPGRRVPVSQAWNRPLGYMIPSRSSGLALEPTILATPILQMYCAGRCKGIRNFEAEASASRELSGETDVFLRYECRNCTDYRAVFALSVYPRPGNKAEIEKYGQIPHFGPRVASRVLALLGPDQDLFKKGRRAESQSLGLGAFAYYRRTVEHMKNRLLEDIIRTCRMTGHDDFIADLERAKARWRFKSSVEDFRPAIPDALMMDGRNPLMLLHRALSGGIHDKDDAECLELAMDVRNVLCELAQRLQSMLADKKALSESVRRLQQAREEKPGKE